MIDSSELISSFVVLLVCLGLYVLMAVGLYTIAKRREIRKPWLAWIPVANMWILGSISDQYRYVVMGQNKSKRKWLPVLNVIFTVAGVAEVILLSFLFVGLLACGMAGLDGVETWEMLQDQVMVPLLVLCGLLVIVAPAYLVMYYMALNDLYTSCDPHSKTLFLVLSIFFGALLPFFLFFSRKKDGGMPPKRQEPVWQRSQDPWDRSQDPWQRRDYE